MYYLLYNTYSYCIRKSDLAQTSVLYHRVREKKNKLPHHKADSKRHFPVRVIFIILAH